MGGHVEGAEVMKSVFNKGGQQFQLKNNCLQLSLLARDFRNEINNKRNLNVKLLAPALAIFLALLSISSFAEDQRPSFGGVETLPVISKKVTLAGCAQCS